MAYTVLVNEYRRIGKNLFEALDEMDEYRAGGPSENGVEASADAARNTDAFNEMNKILAGLG